METYGRARKGMTGSAAVLAALAVAAGCSGGADLAGPNPPSAGSSTVTLSVAVTPGVGGSASLGASSGGLAPALDITQTSGSDVLTLTRVALVLEEIELQRQFADCAGSGSDSEDDSGCEEFEAGPMLLELPLDGSVDQLVSLAVPPGTYDELEFEVHKLGNDPDDASLLAEHPEFAGISIRAEGTFNGTAFVFTQDLDEEQEVPLAMPLVVDETTGPVNLTMRLDVTTWFVRSDGSLIDPSTANKGGPNENLVEDNIKGSIGAFEDDDHDGVDDEKEGTDNGSDSGNDNGSGDGSGDS